MASTRDKLNKKINKSGAAAYGMLNAPSKDEIAKLVSEKKVALEKNKELESIIDELKLNGPIKESNLEININEIKLIEWDREGYKESHLDDLIISIREEGQKENIIVVKNDDGYQLLSGAHRVEALRRIGSKTVKATVVELEDMDSHTILRNMLIYNKYDGLTAYERTLNGEKLLSTLLDRTGESLTKYLYTLERKEVQNDEFELKKEIYKDLNAAGFKSIKYFNESLVMLRFDDRLKAMLVKDTIRPRSASTINTGIKILKDNSSHTHYNKASEYVDKFFQSYENGKITKKIADTFRNKINSFFAEQISKTTEQKTFIGNISKIKKITQKLEPIDISHLNEELKNLIKKYTK